MAHLVAAPDKFRGTATAAQVAEAAAAGARAAGWSAEAVPMADGGEGLLDVVGGRRRRTLVTGPLGAPVVAPWVLDEERGPRAVIEMAAAAGLTLAGGPVGNDPIEATTTGVGELVVAAVAAGAREVVLGCGGSATTDGGQGALAAIGDPARLDGVTITVACDVTTRFTDAARVFGPQKGASPEQVAHLTARLEDLAERYRSRLGAEVADLVGAGAAGGLAGGLAAIGARLVPGAALVAELVGLDDRLAAADLVVTGEGRLDATSFAGKVVDEVIARTPPSVPVLCVVGDADPGALVVGDADPGALVVGDADPGARPAPVEVASLSARYGRDRAMTETTRLVTEVVRSHLARRPGS